MVLLSLLRYDADKEKKNIFSVFLKVYEPLNECVFDSFNNAIAEKTAVSFHYITIIYLADPPYVSP
jgi:hypothetical protein